jgi:hypothetical protein
MASCPSAASEADEAGVPIRERKPDFDLDGVIDAGVGECYCDVADWRDSDGFWEEECDRGDRKFRCLDCREGEDLNAW